MTAPALVLSDLHKSFGHGEHAVRAVNGVDLTVRPGEIVAFLGPNGAGKTTTIDMVLGLTTPSSGEVQVFGASPIQAVRDGRVSAVLQSGGLLRDLTVLETVQAIASLHRAERRVGDVIERAGLAPIARRRVSKCSGGEQQRLRFALALLPDPELLILDEPTAGMDVGTRKAFWETMRAETTTGRTVIFATHYLEEADRFADRIVLISRGRIVADGSTNEIRSLTNVRTITALIDDPSLADEIGTLPGVVDVEFGDQRLVVRTSDSDAVAARLLTEYRARDLLISAPSLDDAFLQLTSEEPA
ncbi:ABC transporter ATP-binding protein [Enemella sp. A6]|uniref:ABC transporter ATP-binding protein n=1 Tax=Enemella sp. A6 TaxID=3440152 RepID=UPI003EC069B6